MTQENPLVRYTILRELGRGAIGTVCAARDRSTGATVALKTLDPALLGAADAKLAELFLKNARSAARLRHQNIVKVHDAGEAGGSAYVAMELVEGESLRRMLDGRPLPLARAVQIFDDIASALAYAHEEGMVHRGVRPSSIFVLPSGVANIGDFGIGQIGEAALPYLSPEQVRGDPVDQRSDLFSLGAVFYEMLTGRAPFAGGSPKEIRESILRAEPPPASEMNPHVPDALDGLVSKLLARNPDDRFATARLVLRDLQRLEEALGLRPGVSAVAAEPPPSVPPSAPEPRLRTPDPTPFRDREPIHDAPRFAPNDARFMKDREPVPEQRSGSRASALAAFALVLALASIGLTVALHYSPDLGERLFASFNRQAPPTMTAAAPLPSTTPSPTTALPLATKAIDQPKIAPAAPPSPAAQDAAPEEPPAVASAPAPLPPKPLAEKPIHPAPPETLPPPEPVKTATASPTPPQKAPQAKPVANIPAPQPAGTAKLTIAISPRGELYIDGKHAGTTPPITTLDLAPGMHRIEIRSGSGRPYLTYMVVEPGDERRIRYDFNSKRIHPPV